MKTRFVASLLAAFVLLGAAQATVYRPGVLQVKYACASSSQADLDYDFDLVAGANRDWTLGFFMTWFSADNASTKFFNPLTETYWNWNDNTTFGYEGMIWLEGGVTYTVYTRFDDGGALVVDGNVVITQGNSSGYNTSVGTRTFTPDATGWQPVRGFVWDWSGGKKPISAAYGLQYNTNNVTDSFTDKAKWMKFEDPGDMTFLKKTTSESFSSLGALSTSEGNLVAAMTFNLPTNASLYVLYGAEAGDVANPSTWSNQVFLASLAPGSLSTNVVVSGLELESEPYVCFYLRTTSEVTAPLHVFEEFLTPFQASGSPSGMITVDAVDYTAASFTATAASLGLGGTSADISVQIAADAEFATIVEAIAVSNGIAAVPTVVSGITNAVPLVTNTTYCARAKVVNQNGAAGYSAAVSFTTLNPGLPVVAGVFAGAGFDYANFGGSLTAYGAGSTNALLYMDVSETADFAAYTAFGGSNIVGQLPAGRGLSAVNLDNGTAYHARIRAVNTWGLTGISATIPFETRLEPFALSPIGATATAGGTQLSMSIIELVEGAIVDATLAIGTTAENAAPVATWNDIATFPTAMPYLYGASSGTYVARYVVMSTYGGEFYAATNTLTFTVGLNVFVAPTLADLVALRLKEGESVALPPLTTQQDFYRVLNGRVGELASGGITLAAVEPGGTGVELWGYDPAGGTNLLSSTGGLIVVPEPVGEGRVYLFKEAASTWNWNDAANWECVSDPGYLGYPDAVDDVAMILYYDQGGKTMTIGTTEAPTVTVGELYAGQLKSVATSLRLQGGSSQVRTLNFERSNGEPARIQLTGGAWDGKEFNFLLGGGGDSTRLTVNAVSDIDYDAGYTFVNDTQQRNKLSWDRLNVNIPAAKALRIINGHPASGVNQASWCWIGSNVRFTGAGLFWHDSMLNATLDYVDFKGFSGTIRDTGFGHGWYDRSANIQFKAPNIANATLEVSGFVTKDFTATTSAGYCAWGINHGYGDSGPVANRVPEKRIAMSGGIVDFRPEKNTSWGPGSVQTNMTEVLEVGKGLSLVALLANDGDDRFPTNTFTAWSLATTNKGTLVISESRTRNNSTTTKGILTLGGFAQHAIGGTGDLTTETYPIIPWIVAMHGNQYTIRFAAVNGLNQMHRPVYVNVAPDAVTDPLRNVYADSQSIALSADRTVNSLWLQNRNQSKRIGAGRSLTISSGGLILHGDGTKIGEQSGAAENGSLVFGNTAYVYAMSTSATDPAQIWSPVTAPKGFVCGYFGNLLLAGDQTGIDDEIVVNNGTLMLGSLDGTVKAQIDADVRIVSRNAKVKVNALGSLNAVDVRFDDAYQFSGKIEVPAGQTEKCRMLFIGGGEDSMPRGTYGSSASAAEFVDDRHFAGTGVLVVSRDTLCPPTVIIVR
jgi:hypothetical protein